MPCACIRVFSVCLSVCLSAVSMTSAVLPECMIDDVNCSGVMIGRCDWVRGRGWPWAVSRDVVMCWLISRPCSLVTLRYVTLLVYRTWMISALSSAVMMTPSPSPSPSVVLCCISEWQSNRVVSYWTASQCIGVNLPPCPPPSLPEIYAYVWLHDGTVTEWWQKSVLNTKR